MIGKVFAGFSRPWKTEVSWRWGGDPAKKFLGENSYV